MATASQHNLSAFWKKNPEFIWGPATLSAAFYAYSQAPKVAARLAERGWATYGFHDTLMYTGFAIILAYATEGWYRLHVGQPRQLQSYDGKQKLEKPSSYADRPAPTAAAVRTVAALLTSIVYAFVPFAPVSSSWPVFAAWVFGFAVYWDIHFFIVHKAVHENRWLYKNTHKLHHTHKQPGVFTAYFVTYQSHVLTEQSVVFLAAACGLPRDVFTWVMWWGTLMTYVEHGGHDVESVKLSPLPLTFGQLSTILAPWSLVLGGATPAEHDWHHEKFTTNYALNFKILDQIFGSYHPGREPGACVKEASEAALALSQAPAEAPQQAAEPVAEAKEAEGAKPPTAQYTELRKSTPQDWVVQGAAFDKYAADGNILRNILELVKNMKRGEVGAVVDMYEHSLQTATRARRGGADTETIVCALLHDIGEVLSATNHGEIPAAILRPYISPMNHWLLYNHEVFQAYFFLDKCGGDKDLRDKVKEYKAAGITAGHPYYEACAKFCLEYDQMAFDPTYDTDTLESFLPLVEEVLGRKPYWWEPDGKAEEDLDCKARLCFGYSLTARDTTVAGP